MTTLHLGRFVFRPRPFTTLLALAGIVLTLLLGQWQVGRAAYKAGLQARQDALSREPAVTVGAGMVPLDDVLLRKVEVRGEFVPKHTVFIDNRLYNHQPGYHVVTPLRIAGSQRHVLINRGWVAANRDRSRPDVPTPAGEQRIEGVAVGYSERHVELSDRVTEGNVWQNVSFDRYREATGLDLQPFVVQQETSLNDGLTRVWNRPDLGRNTHLAYAFQWYALSLAILIYYLVTHVKRRPEEQS